MRKLIFLILAVSVLGGSVYALFPSLFPDTATFPRIPAGDGTIGGVIAKIIGTTDLGNPVVDGTVANTQKLGGRTATGYLGTRGYCPPGQVYTSISTTSQAICTLKNATLLTDLGRIVSGSGSVKIYHASGSISTPTTYPYIVQSGDIIDTPPGGEATVIFTDDSVLRLDSDTTLALDAGDLSSGRAIASILLESGQVWGRILTLTGSYTVGSRDIVAGVRGTSISLAKTGATSVTLTYDSQRATWDPTITGTQYPSSLSIVHTSLTTPSAADISCSDGRSLTMRSGESITSSGICPLSATSTPVSTLWADAWINKNTQEDLRYMLTLRTLSGGLVPSGTPSTIEGGTVKDLKVASEIIATNPATPLEQSTLCASSEQWYPDYGCQPRNLLAIADYTRGDTKFYKVSVAGSTAISPSNLSSFTQIKSTDYVRNGVKIEGAQYLEYDKSSIESMLGVFNSKTIKIVFANSLESNTMEILNIGVGQVKISAIGDLECRFITCQSLVLDSSRLILVVKLPSSLAVTEFKVGGDGTNNNSINNTIRSISIY